MIELLKKNLQFFFKKNCRIETSVFTLFLIVKMATEHQCQGNMATHNKFIKGVQYSYCSEYYGMHFPYQPDDHKLT